MACDNTITRAVLSKQRLEKRKVLIPGQRMKGNPVNDFIEVRSSPLGGLGIYARKNIPPQTMLLKEEPVLIATDDEDIHGMYAALYPQRQREFDLLHWWWERSSDPLLGRFMTNEFGIAVRGKRNFGVVAIVVSRFNHDCEPSAKVMWESEKGVQERGYVRVDTVREVRKGEEITICYSSDTERLYHDYGFECKCKKCESRREEFNLTRRYHALHPLR